MNANTMQVGGTHYVGKYQHWDFAADLRLGYFEGQITKYVSRWRKKNGVQDVEKAMHFLTKLIELVEAGWSCTSGAVGWRDKDYSGRSAADVVMLYCVSNEIHPLEQDVITSVSLWMTVNHLYRARDELGDLLRIAPAILGDAGPGYVNQDR